MDSAQAWVNWREDMVIDHLLYGTVLCLTGCSSGNTAQCAYLGSSIEPSRLFVGRERSRLPNIDRCVTRSGSLSRTVRRTPNRIESSLPQARDRPPPWHDEVNKASPSIVLLRTVTVYRLEKFYVDYKIINTIHIHSYSYSYFRNIIQKVI